MVLVRVLFIAMSALALSALMAGDAEVAAPTPVPDAEAFLVAIVPDLRATLTRAEHIAGMFSPVPLPPGTLATSVGAALGDPGLANLGKGPVLIVLGPGVPTPTIALLLPATDAKRYVDLAAQKGFLMGSVVKDVAVVSQTPEGQALGEKVAAASLPSVPAGTDIRLLVAPDRLMKAYGTFLTGMVQMAAMNMPQKPGEMPMGKILPLEVAGLQEVLGALDGMQLDVTLNGGTVALDEVLSASAGSALAKALVPPAGFPNRAAQRFSAAPGMMAMSGRVNVAAAHAYLLGLIDSLRARPDGKELIPDAIVEAVKGAAGVYTGDFAFRMRAGEKAPFLAETAAGISDPVKLEHVLDQFEGLFQGDSALAKMYQGMGMTMKVTKNVRQAGGLPVAVQSWVLDETKMAQPAVMKTMLQDTQIVIGKDYTATAQDAASLDALVAGAGPGLATQAEKTFGPGRHVYVDVDLVSLIMAQMQALAVGGGDKPKLAPGEPMTLAVTYGAGRLRIEHRIPLAPFVGMSAAMQNMGPQRPKRAPAAQPAPAGGNTF